MPGLNLFGGKPQATTPFQGGLLCVASPVHRLPAQSTGGAGACTGSLVYTLSDVLQHPAGGALVPGTLLAVQSWSRDLGDPFGSSLSDAVEFSICP